MNRQSEQPPSSRSEFAARLRAEGARRYHHEHPFHRLMHEGQLTRHQLQQWVLNRYYYQTRIPIKDALILSKSENPAFRRTWIHRIHDHDGMQDNEGGLALWLQLARAVGLDDEEVRSLRSVLPGVRAACDSYVSFVQQASLVEAVASSLTELFAPNLMSARLAAWERHYPWVDRAALEYFQARVSRAAQDSDEALSFVLFHAVSHESQTRCVAALIRKTEILWALLDSLYTAYVTGTFEETDDHDPRQPPDIEHESAPAVRSDLA